MGEEGEARLDAIEDQLEALSAALTEVAVPKLEALLGDDTDNVTPLRG